MKSKIILFLLMTGFIITLSAQESTEGPIPLPVEVKNGMIYWNGLAVNDIADKSDLVFEGRILTDSVCFLNPPGIICTYHKVLVFKKFKGTFKSDTIMVASRGGKMVFPGSNAIQGDNPYCHMGDEAVFLVSSWSKKSGDSELFYILYGNGCGYITICDKKDVIKEVYEPIEAVTGQKYVEVHPNNCATQKK